MNTYNIKLTDDITIPVRANSPEEAQRIIRAEMVKREASPLFDKVYFDYETGINVPRLRAALGRQEKKEEKENVLRAYVDSSGFTETTKGDFAITPEGQRALADKGLLDREKISDKNIVIEENKFGTAGDFADFSGAVGPIFGAIAALSPQLRIAKGIQYFFKSPMVSNAIAAGLGSAGGKAAEESLDLAQGYQEKDANELADLLKFEFGVGSVAQGVGDIGMKAVGAFFGRKAPIENIRDAWAANKGVSLDDVYKLEEKLGKFVTESDLKKAIKRGEIKPLNAKAVLGQRVTGRALQARFQGAGETIFGKTKREKTIIDYNLDALNQLKNKIADKRAKLNSYSDFAESDSRVISELKARRAELDKAESSVQNELTRLLTDLSEETAGFNSAIMNAGTPGKKELGQNVQDTISAAYKAMMDDQRLGYKKIGDSLKKLNPDYTINMSDVGVQLDEIFTRGRGIGIGDIPNPIIKLRNAIEENAEFTLKDLVEDRKIIRGLKDLKDLTGDAGEAVTSSLKALDDKIENLPNNLHSIKGSKEEVIEIINALKKQNASYANSLKPFDKAKVQKIMSNKEIDADDVFNVIFNGKEIGDAKAIIQAIPSAKRAALQQGLLRRYLKEQINSSVPDPITGIVNPVQFANKVLKNKEVLSEFLGPRASQFFQTIEDFSKLRPNLSAKELTDVADELAGRIPQMEAMSGAGTLNYPPSFNRFVEALKEKAETSAQSLEIQKSNIFTRLESASPEEVAKIVFRPKSSEDILRVKNLVSDEAFLDIQDQALEQILKDGVQEGSNKLSDIFKPGNLERALRSYDNETLTAMFGKEMTQSLNNYARQLRVTVQDEITGGAGSLVAGALALNVFNVALWPTVAMMGLYKTVFSNPRIVGMLAKTDKSSIAEVVKFVANTIKFGGIRGLAVETGDGADAFSREVEKLQQSEEGQEAQGILETLKGGIQSEVKKLQTPTLEGLPEVAAVTPPQSQGVISQSLLGGSPANMDIAQSLGRLT
tara:strand:+ start:2355 stop:5363 length:3009 start_codon:yes stop_codon:yes gene_type:complete